MLMKGAFVSLFIVCLTLSIGYMEMFRRLIRLEEFLKEFFDVAVQYYEKTEDKSTTESE